MIPPETSTDTIAVTPGERPDTVPVGVPATDTGWDDLWCANRDATLIITGPATNLATYLRTHPAHQRIYLMSGAYLYPGNTTPTAEWNTWVDPHAAAEVFHATIPITVCPWGALPARDGKHAALTRPARCRMRYSCRRTPPTG